MKNELLLFVFCLSSYFPEATADAEKVWLKDVTTRLKSDKREVSGPVFPDQLSFYLKRKTHGLILNLKRNYHIDPNTDIYIAQKLKDGRPILEKMQNMEKSDVAYYQDMENGAFMTARRVKKSSGQFDIFIKGNIRLGDRSYDLRPAEADVVPNDFFEITGLRGKRYILQDQNNLQSGMSFENNAQSNVIENELQEKHIGRLPQRRIPYGQDEPNLILNPDIIFSTRKFARLKKPWRTGKNNDDKARNLKRYYVDVVVLSDSEIWELFLSIARRTGNDNASEKAISDIREYLLHVINGVDQLYKGITDHDVVITVSIRAFVILPTQQDFPHISSTVHRQGGQSMIDGDKYLQDLTHWDINIGSQSLPAFDQVILFTRHVISSGDPFKSDFNGRAITGSVCEIGRRVSIVRVNDFFITTRTAAHVLGHALGAIHDGDGDARACSSSEEFIMSSDKPTFNRRKKYKENPWHFSVCSVNAFKRTLLSKECVTTQHVHDQDIADAYEKVLRKPAGKRFKPDQQCAIINGFGSTSCGIKEEQICRLMRCTHPVTNRCQDGFFSAAPGTQCDIDKHCQKGVCVAVPQRLVHTNQ